MAVHTTDYPTPPPIAARLGGAFIAVAVWAGGVAFTRQALPLPRTTDELGQLAPWMIAIIAQLALSLAQMNLRHFGLDRKRWPYLLLVGIDVMANVIGLLVTYAVISAPGVIVPYVVRAVTTGAGLWELVAAIIAGVITAVLPEQLLRDALGR